MYAPQDQPRGLPFAQASRLVQPPTVLWGMVFSSGPCPDIQMLQTNDL